MSKVTIQGDANGTGIFTIASPNSNTDRTLTLPDEAGTVLTTASDVAQKGVPIFEVTLTSNQAISNATETKVAFNSVITDTHSYWDSSNYRYKPQITGWYQFNVALKYGSNITDQTITYIYKNGSMYRRGGQQGVWSNDPTTAFGCLVYLNGTTDYVEIYGYKSSSSGSMQFNGGSNFLTWMNGFLVRAE